MDREKKDFGADPALASQAPAGLVPAGFDPGESAHFNPSCIPWSHGGDDDVWGTRVWAHRIENLRTDLEIILGHLPEDERIARGQVKAGIAKANRYLGDWCPSAALVAEKARAALSKALTPQDEGR